MEIGQVACPKYSCHPVHGRHETILKNPFHLKRVSVVPPRNRREDQRMRTLEANMAKLERMMATATTRN